ncbi:polyribonucleotide nucleotidyltransferase [Candidatus Dojkabacteria bacterium]|uniref:Polyribonucleotide nucleotidyltransferase n=1 Tax=Candidatus Dojkabacteria bacterium TaxID=2099670 RepID=A0A955L3J1_9BACT|nr:polyribonucleotide nucleotidyltransferase [Candidatus Dojkabacteria bacterium]
MDKNTSVVVKELTLNGTQLSLETGRLAGQANGSVFARWGETALLATVTMSRPAEGLDYFPLTVEYIEKLYAGGKISSSRFVKRERFPSNDAILKARLIDRSLRPLFPEGFMNEVQIIITVLSYDEENDPSILAVTAASAALMISDVPFEGPVTGIRIGRINGEEKVFPTIPEMETSDMELVVSCTKDAVVMLEAGAEEVEEEVITKGIDTAMESAVQMFELQEELVKVAGKDKAEYTNMNPDEELMKTLSEEYKDKFKAAIVADKHEFYAKQDELLAEIVEKYEGEYSKSFLKEIVFTLIKKELRRMVLEEDKRIDGRPLDQVRTLSSETTLLPRVHGSGLFNRGLTQVLTTVTLGSREKEMTVESMDGEETKRYMHYYNFPSYSTGETGRFRFIPGRREIGHGALAEKALLPVIPKEEDFPYTIIAVSEVMSSDGSTSMASTCGSTLALMDAGVPIIRPVAGIAMGLVSDNKTYKVLTDIAGIEDHIGDMDFKVTGTEKGITAIQMDNKLKGVPSSVLAEGLAKAKVGRAFIMESMMKTLSSPKSEMSKYAPKIEMVRIPKDKIGELIGPGGKVVKGIIEKTGANVNIDDDGTVSISHNDSAKIEEAKRMVNEITMEAEMGAIYEGTVAKIMPFGAFVDVGPSVSGLVHVSEMSNEFVKDPSDIVKEGDRVKVKVIKIDPAGKVSFTMKDLPQE